MYRNSISSPNDIKNSCTKIGNLVDCENKNSDKDVNYSCYESPIENKFFVLKKLKSKSRFEFDIKFNETNIQDIKYVYVSENIIGFYVNINNVKGSCTKSVSGKVYEVYFDISIQANYVEYKDKSVGKSFSSETYFNKLSIIKKKIGSRINLYNSTDLFSFFDKITKRNVIKEIKSEIDHDIYATLNTNRDSC